MKKASLLSTIFLLAVLSTGVLFASDGNENGFMPKWKIGEEWILEASHKDLKSDNVSWMAPIRWVFKVRSLKTINGTECYVLHVFAANTDIKDQAVLYLSTENLRPVRVIDIFKTSSGMKYNKRDIEEDYAQPLLAEDTIVPYDLPAFPLVKDDENNAAQGVIADTLGRIKEDVSRDIREGVSEAKTQIREAFQRKFANVRNVGGLRYKRSVTQIQAIDLPAPIVRGNGVVVAQGARLHSQKDNSKVFSIQLNEERSGNKLKQTWRVGYPWAVASTRKDRKVRLVKYSSSGQNSEGGNQ